MYMYVANCCILQITLATVKILFFAMDQHCILFLLQSIASMFLKVVACASSDMWHSTWIETCSNAAL